MERPTPSQATTLEFVGTATTVLRLGPFTILTDPNFLHRGQRAYLGKGLFSKRQTERSMQPADLPALDAVLLSHLHGDHFDRMARDQLDQQLPVLTTPQASQRLQRWGFSGARGLQTWQAMQMERDGSTLTVTSVPGEHAPGVARWLLPPVMGSVLELTTAAGSSFRLYISGDTLYRPWLREVTQRCGWLDAALLHLGGTRALGMLVTMDGKQGADLVDLLGPAVSLPIHYDDYTVFRSPLRDFEAEWKRRELPGTLRTVHRGETINLGP